MRTLVVCIAALALATPVLAQTNPNDPRIVGPAKVSAYPDMPNMAGRMTGKRNEKPETKSTPWFKLPDPKPDPEAGIELDKRNLDFAPEHSRSTAKAGAAPKATQKRDQSDGSRKP